MPKKLLPPEAAPEQELALFALRRTIFPQPSWTWRITKPPSQHPSLTSAPAHISSLHLHLSHLPCYKQPLRQRSKQMLLLLPIQSQRRSSIRHHPLGPAVKRFSSVHPYTFGPKQRAPGTRTTLLLSAFRKQNLSLTFSHPRARDFSYCEIFLRLDLITSTM